MTKLDPKQLKALKKQLKKKQKASKIARQKAQTQKSGDNRNGQTFRQAMSGVTPLKQNKIHHQGNKPKAKLMNLPADEPIQAPDMLSDPLHVEKIDSEQIISFYRAGIQKTVFRKLRTGNYQISDKLDLHGMTIKQAKQMLLNFLHEAVQFENSCVCIIHGKGYRSNNRKPVLKNYVNHWLSEHDRVLAFHTTRPSDGGAGALYVLLKRQEPVRK